MTQERKSLGRLGEELAVSFLKKKGYKILETNFVIKGFGELDIICKKKDKIVFVEVRTKSSRFFGTPEESITPKKQQKLMALAHCYLSTKKWHYKDFAIDGVFVEFRREECEIRHLENMLQDFE
ncbi:YraN family protein [Patescibacteria group bacterium]|nr:YraN family protein [Patescibacteria group bacterium]